MDREPFLNKVRIAAQAGRAFSVPIHPFPPETGYVGLAPGESLCQRLAVEINNAGGEAVVVSSLAAAQTQLRAWLKEASTGQALCWEHPLLNQLDLPMLLAEEQLRLISHASLSELPPEQALQEILACQIGITSAVLAVAETGSLWMHAQIGQERVASLTPPRHLAIVQRKQILPDLIDAFNWLEQQGWANLPSNIALITGPSKTGDIELQLTTGVHGPGRWQVIVIDADL